MPTDNGKIYGKFKKILLDELELKIESIELSEKLSDLEKRKNNSFEFGKEFFDLFLNSRLNKKNKKISKQVYGVSKFIFESFQNWESKNWNFELIFFLPTTYEMLQIQAKGKRYVSILFKEIINGILIENKRDGFEHFLHDLAHGFHFFKNRSDYEKQILFFKHLEKNYSKFEIYFYDLEFKNKFEYCLSDMNSNPIHLQEYLKAILIEHFKKKSNVFHLSKPEEDEIIRLIKF